MINKKIKGLIKETDGGLGREFFPRGAIVWIPVALFVLLVLFQMMPLPAGVLKVVSPATYELYEEMLPEVGERQRSAVYAKLRRAKEVGGQRTEVGCQKSEDGGQRSEVSRLRTRRAPAATVRKHGERALSRQEATSCQGGLRSEIGKGQRSEDGWG